jgi:hypothetical protein
MREFWLMYSLAAGLMLTGCGGKSEPLTPPPMAIAPGYIRLDSGKQIQVIGYDPCPGQSHTLIGRVESAAMEKHCTVIGGNARVFDLSVATSQGVVVERWSVVAETRSIKLMRPDGDGATVFKVVN